MRNRIDSFSYWSPGESRPGRVECNSLEILEGDGRCAFGTGHLANSMSSRLIGCGSAAPGPCARPCGIDVNGDAGVFGGALQTLPGAWADPAGENEIALDDSDDGTANRRSPAEWALPHSSPLASPCGSRT